MFPPALPTILQAATVGVEPVVGDAPPSSAVGCLCGPAGPPTIGGPLGRAICPLMMPPCFLKVTFGLSGAQCLESSQSDPKGDIFWLDKDIIIPLLYRFPGSDIF